MKNILVVDDEPLIANGVPHLVASFDFPLVVKGIYTDSEEALAFCQQNTIDIVITDINMPKVNGHSCLPVHTYQNQQYLNQQIAHHFAS